MWIPGSAGMTPEGRMASEATFLDVQFLRWVAERPRRHRDLREAWSSTCPLNCAWEDAISDDLVRFADDLLVLTERGRARLADSATPAWRSIVPADIPDRRPPEGQPKRRIA